MRAFFSDLTVNGQCSKKRKQDQQQGCDGRKHSGGKKGNAGLVTECGEIVDARKAHYLPPGVLVPFVFAFVGPFELDHALVKPPG